MSTGNPLPAAITLTASDTSPTGSIEQLERFEGMRVHVDSLTAVSPTQGTINETNATSTSNGVFYGVITGVDRPFREPGVEVPDPLPPGSPCCVPRFDANPERLRVDSDAIGAPALEVTSGALVTNLTGPHTHGDCNFAMVYHIEHGEYGGTTLDGLNFAVVGHAPGPSSYGCSSPSFRRATDATCVTTSAPSRCRPPRWMERLPTTAPRIPRTGAAW